MTITIADMLLYSGALFILFLTPGPVWMAIAARSMSGGFRAAWPLALGVVVGDAVWPLLAIFGVSWIVSVFADFMVALRWTASAIFIIMGFIIIRNAGREIASDSRLTRPGMWAGFVAGVAVILSNPKAVLFYMGVLPGFFDLTSLTTADIAMIMFLSMIVPFIGNLFFSLAVERLSRLLTSPAALRRTNLVAGSLLIGIGLILPLV